MQEISPFGDRLFPITLAADGRYAPIDVSNDQVWELFFQSGEPLSLGIQTTYGLRARLMRIYPQFNLNDAVMTNPSSFYRRPQVLECFPNYAKISYSPFSGIDVVSEVWVPESHAVTCRSTITNSRVVPLHFRMQWVANLIPLGDGHGMIQMVNGKQPVLFGRTTVLAPVFLHSGNVTHSPQHFPSLEMIIDLPPGGNFQGTWVHATMPDYQSSLDLATSFSTRPWDSEIAHIELFNASQLVEIQTGDPDWNTAFALSQNLAFSLLMCQRHEPGVPQFAHSRRVDQGYSPVRKNADNRPGENTLSLFDLYYLTGLLLPGGLEYIRSAIQEVLPNPQYGRPGYIPVLASLAWKIFEIDHDQSFLAEVFPALLECTAAWFDYSHDHDEDGFPELGDTFRPDFQTSFQNQPADLNIFIESPGLAAFVLNEIHFISKMGKELNQVGQTLDLQQKVVRLQKAVESTWDRSRYTYRDRDRDTHFSDRGTTLLESTGAGILELHRDFKKPQRLVIKIEAKELSTPKASLTLWGAGVSGEAIEESLFENFRPFSKKVFLVTLKTYVRVDRIEVRDISAADRVSIDSVDFSRQDITLLLPLWGHIPDAQRAEVILKKTVSDPDRYFQPFGMPTYPGKRLTSSYPGQPNISLFWNQLICEGLLAYGFREAAAQHFSRLMGGIVLSLEKRGAFSQTFNARTGKPSGERNSLDGLAPYGLFLDIAGIKLISPFSVIITDFNPFPWPITVKYRGLNVIRQEKQTQIIFPDGQTASVSDPGSHWVSLL